MMSELDFPFLKKCRALWKAMGGHTEFTGSVDLDWSTIEYVIFNLEQEGYVVLKQGEIPYIQDYEQYDQLVRDAMKWRKWMISNDYNPDRYGTVTKQDTTMPMPPKCYGTVTQEGGESESEKIIEDSLDVLDQDEKEEKELPTMSNSERASYIRYRLEAAGCTIVKTVPKDGFTEAEYRQELRREYAKAIKAQESADE